MEINTARIGGSFLFFTLGLVSHLTGSPMHDEASPINGLTNQSQSLMDTITLGAGCFWCIEAIFEGVEGVESTVSGYMGGSIKNPSYREVCTGNTGHAEVVQVVYNPDILDLNTLLDVFFATHDPTTMNRQGGDIGTQYRSAIFCHSENQRQMALDAVARSQSDWDRPIVTQIETTSHLYIAEDYHQAYFELNGEAPYCQSVIAPKVRKMRSSFLHLLKNR